MTAAAAASPVQRTFARDGVLWMCAAVYLLTVLGVILAHASPTSTAGSFHHYTESVLLGMTLAALLLGRSRVSPQERRFWDILAVAWACWLLVEALYFFDVPLPLFSANFTIDVLYILFYLVFALAVDLQPHIKSGPSPALARRRLESVAGLTTVFGVLIYFAIVVLPEPLGVSLSFVPREQGFAPALLVRLILDLLLLGRLIYAAVKSDVRWRRLYGLLICAMIGFTIRETLAVLLSENLVTMTRSGLAYELFLTLPALCVVFAARYRHVPDDEASERDAQEERLEPVRTSPLVLYAVTVPALHFLLYPLGVLEPTSRAPREMFSLLFILTLGLMAWVHQGLIAKDSRRAGEALRKAEERLFRSQRLESVGRLAGGIAHDFNNYLTVIRGYSELLGVRLTDAEAKEEIGYVADAANKATNLTRQLLAFGRRQVLRPEPLDLNLVILETSKLLRSLLGEDVVLQLDLDPDVDHAQADLGQTEQVLMNLALNGRHAMPRGGTLSIRTRRVSLDDRDASDLDLDPGTYVGLTIVDTGCGMSDDVKARAFEPFFTTREQGKGTGLGLSTVHGIMAQSGGGISLESTIGSGTSVHVFFPRADAQPGSETSPGWESLPGISNATLLVVEDDDQVRDLVVKALSSGGFDVYAASGGPEALRLFAECPPVDLLVTDVMMADMDGVELAAELVERRPDLRVLFMSGYPADTLRERQAVLPQSIELLEKPFTAATLVAKVRGVLSDAAREGRSGGTPVGLDARR